MCDEQAFDRAARWRAQKALSRRDIGRVAGAAAVATLLPGALSACSISKESEDGDTVDSRPGANPLPVADRMVTIATPDGEAQAHFAHPTDGAHAAVLVWPDAFGLRDALRDMGKRLAGAGYAVLTINPYYRMVEPDILPEDAPRGMASFETIKPYYSSIRPEMTVTDARAMFAWLDAQKEVDTALKAGTTGYCMGGAMVFRTAATLADHIGAGASFHGGGLVTDKPDSPHLLIPEMQSAMLVAVAADDDAEEPEQKNVLREAFAKAGRTATVEVYQASHGWMPPDTEAHDAEEAERGWAAKLDLFRQHLV